MEELELDSDYPEGGEDVEHGPVALHSVTALSGMYQD